MEATLPHGYRTEPLDGPQAPPPDAEARLQPTIRDGERWTLIRCGSEGCWTRGQSGPDGALIAMIPDYVPFPQGGRLKCPRCKTWNVLPAALDNVTPTG